MKISFKNEGEIDICRQMKAEITCDQQTCTTKKCYDATEQLKLPTWELSSLESSYLRIHFPNL